MKKWIATILSLMFILLYPLSSFAEQYYTLPEVREQAANGWHQTYEAYGRTISVSLDVDVPDADTFPALHLVCAYLPTPTAKWDTPLNVWVRPESNLVRFETSEYPQPVSGKIDKKPEAVYVSPREMDKAYAVGSDLTLGDALMIVRHSLETFGYSPTDYQIDKPFLLRTSSFLDAKTKKPVYPGVYYMFFHQSFNGIPLLTHTEMAAKERSFGYYPDDGMNACVVSDHEIDISMRPLKIDKQLTEDLPLCSFDKIIKAIETEINVGHIRKVYRLELGYAMQDDPEYVNPDHLIGNYYAIPMWRLDCVYLSNARAELPKQDEDVFEIDNLEYATIVINAQTGEMMDYQRNAEKGDPYQGYLTWEEVGGQP